MHKDSETPHVMGPTSEARSPLISDDDLLAVQGRQARMQCLQQYLLGAVAQKDAARAGFGVITGELMAVTMPLAELLKKNLNKPSVSTENLQKMLPTLDAYYRLTRLIERFGQLDVRLATMLESKSSECASEDGL